MPVKAFSTHHTWQILQLFTVLPLDFSECIFKVIEDIRGPGIGLLGHSYHSYHSYHNEVVAVNADCTDKEKLAVSVSLHLSLLKSVVFLATLVWLSFLPCTCFLIPSPASDLMCRDIKFEALLA